MADDVTRSEGTEDLLAREYTNDEKYHVLTEESYKLICGLLYDLRHVGDIIEDDSIATNKTWSANKLSDLNSDNIKNDELVVHELSEVNTWLDITAADLAAHKTLIADNSISVNKTWSSNKVSEEFEKYVPQNALSEDETVTEFLVKLNDIVGNLDDLTTDNKESLVDAIVELITKVGDITTLETPHKETVVDSINDLHSRLLPVGSVLPFGGAATEVPEGFLLCDGSEYAIEDYPELFASIQHTYIKDTNTKLYNPNSYGYLDAGLSIIIFVLSCALYSKLVSFLLSLTGPFYKYIQSNYGFKLVINVLLAQIYVMLYSVIYAKIRKVSLFSGGGYTCKVDLVSASMGCVLALGVILLFSDLHELIVSYLDQLFPQNAINVSDSNGDLWILLEAFILAPILPAFAEEAFMRGIVFRSLEKFGAFFAIIAMGVFFALFHGNPSQLFIQMIGGMLFGMLFYATKNFFVTSC